VPPQQHRLLPRGVQALAAEGSERLQHSKPRPLRLPPHLKDRLVDQRGERVQHYLGRQPCVGADVLGGRQVEVGGEHRGPPPQQLLVGFEQVVAPLQGGAQGLVPWWRGGLGVAQQPEPVVEAGQYLGWGEGAQAHRGQLDRQRDAVQAAAQLGGRGLVGRRELQVGRDRAGPVHQQVDRVAGSGDAWRAWGRCGQRRDGEQPFTGDVQRPPAGGQHVQLRAGAKQRVDQHRARVAHLLAVVEDQQQPLGSDHLGDGAGQPAPAEVVDVQGARDLLGHQRRVAQRAEVSQLDPAAEQGSGVTGRP
jgi:hypothetical protein